LRMVTPWRRQVALARKIFITDERDMNCEFPGYTEYSRRIRESVLRTSLVAKNRGSLTGSIGEALVLEDYPGTCCRHHETHWRTAVTVLPHHGTCVPQLMVIEHVQNNGSQRESVQV
jgi:hypothetical protein